MSSRIFGLCGGRERKRSLQVTLFSVTQRGQGKSIYHQHHYRKNTTNLILSREHSRIKTIHRDSISAATLTRTWTYPDKRNIECSYWDKNEIWKWDFPINAYDLES